MRNKLTCITVDDGETGGHEAKVNAHFAIENADGWSLVAVHADRHAFEVPGTEYSFFWQLDE